LLYILFSIDFATNKIEEKTGMDINKDGRIGGSGMGGSGIGGSGMRGSGMGGGGITGKIEQATNMDINRDGIIGGHKAPGGGGGMYKSFFNLFLTLINFFFIIG
jgi:hypothetical protein